MSAIPDLLIKTPAFVPGTVVSDPVELARLAKNAKISQTRKDNVERRKGMVKRTIKLKVQKNHVSRKKQGKVDQAYLQAKWIRNHVIHSQYPFEVEIKDTVPVHMFNPISGRCDFIEIRPLTLGSQMVMVLVQQVRQDIINLAKKKAKGHSVGALHGVQEVNCLPLPQNGITYALKGDHVRIQNIGWLKVNGTEQVTPGMELAQAQLVRKPSGLYVHILTYSPPVPQEKNGRVLGCDKGVKSPVVLSSGAIPDLKVEYPEDLKKAYQTLSRSRPGSKGRMKARKVIARKHEDWANQKEDKVNQLVHDLKEYSLIVAQNDNVAAWKRLWGKALQQVAHGRITESLARLPTFLAIDRWIPTTQECPKCLKLNLIPLEERIYACACGFREDRDVKAAKTMACYGLYQLAHPSRDLRRLTVEERTSVYGIYDRLADVRVPYSSPSVEAVSPDTLDTPAVRLSVSVYGSGADAPAVHATDAADFSPR